MEGTNIGTVFASIKLDTGPFTKSIQAMNTAIAQMGSGISSMLGECNKAQVGLQNLGKNADEVSNSLVKVGAVAGSASAQLVGLMGNCSSLAGMAGSTAGALNQITGSASGIGPAMAQSAGHVNQLTSGFERNIAVTSNIATILNTLIGWLSNISPSAASAGSAVGNLGRGLAGVGEGASVLEGGMAAVFQRMARASSTITSFSGATGTMAAGITEVSTVAETRIYDISQIGVSMADDNNHRNASLRRMMPVSDAWAGCLAA